MSKQTDNRTADARADSLDPVVMRRLRKTILLQDKGTPDEQKNNLVDAILETFGNPDKWPMDDGSRICFLKELYRRAQTIRETEAACKAA